MSEWFGALPERWEVRYLSQTCNEQCTKNVGNKEDNVLSLSYGQIIRKKNKYAGLTPSDFSTYQIVEKGDIILRLTDLQNDHTSLRTGLVRERGIITSAYCCLKPWESPEYLQYLLHAYDTQKYFYGLGGGVRQSIGFKDIRYINIPLPPRLEQDQIVRFLAWKVSRTNKLINSLKWQIALLQEQKRAIIDRAVTKGIDPNQELANTDLPWLSEMPAHWQVKKLKSLAAVQSGVTLNSNLTHSSGREYPYLSVANVQFGQLDLTKVKTIRFPEVEAARYLLRQGDLLMTEGGDIDKLGRGAIWHGEIDPCLHQNHVYAVRCDGDIKPQFLVSVLSSSVGRNYFEMTGKQTTNLATTNKTTLQAFALAVPPLREQSAIVAMLDAQCSKINRLEEKFQEEIALLHEYRTRLISDVVTGKMDVRGVAVPEFEVVEEGAEETDAEESDEALDDEEAVGE